MLLSISGHQEWSSSLPRTSSHDYWIICWTQQCKKIPYITNWWEPAWPLPDKHIWIKLCEILHKVVADAYALRHIVTANFISTSVSISTNSYCACNPHDNLNHGGHECVTVDRHLASRIGYICVIRLFHRSCFDLLPDNRSRYTRTRQFLRW